MPRAKNAELVAHIDCEGGGQVWADGDRLYVGHMKPPLGTSIYSIADPTSPRLLGTVQIPSGWHSHKIRAAGDIMVVNHERLGDRDVDGFRGGLAVYDVSDPTRPAMIGKWETDGKGVHRFDFDGRYVYLSATAAGFRGNIAVILDLVDPSEPVEVSRWWIPGQWTAGGEEYLWDDFATPMCHHPLRHGDRLYVSYWHHGLYILDIGDLEHPTAVGHSRRSPAFPHPTHTCLRVPDIVKGRQVMIVADEDVSKLRPSPPAFAMVYDISVESLPTPIATITVPGIDVDGSPQEPHTGCHQPAERFFGTVVPFAWFANGLQVFDIADPFLPTHTAFYLPDPAVGQSRCCSNDVTTDENGLIYLIDRVRGLDVIALGPRSD
jgi:hypothetical protein